jgi:hypothetical protein
MDANAATSGSLRFVRNRPAAVDDTLRDLQREAEIAWETSGAAEQWRDQHPDKPNTATARRAAYSRCAL